jgi:putative flippase GtrA
MIARQLFDRILVKFILVGILNTLVGSAVMFALYNAAHLNYWLSSACNYIFTSVLSFFLNKYFTFNVRRWSALMVLAFVLTIAVSYALAYGIAKPAVNHFLRNNPQKTRENTALFFGLCLFTALNYAGQRLIVFKGKNHEPK